MLLSIFLCYNHLKIMSYIKKLINLFYSEFRRRGNQSLLNIFHTDNLYKLGKSINILELLQHSFKKSVLLFKQLLYIYSVVKVIINIPKRSEERRVGKECRSRWLS